MSSLVVEPISAHNKIWAQIHAAIEGKRFPQSSLMIGTPYDGIAPFMRRLSAILLCRDKTACGLCDSCQLYEGQTHPDIECIRAESEEKSIKIEQIRTLQLTVYQTPKRASHRVFIIESAEKMNASAANALLKILEEPPKHVFFILTAQHLGAILPTILSRCQKFVLPAANLLHAFESQDKALEDALTLDKQKLVGSQETILAMWCEVVEGKKSVCQAASEWSAYDFTDLVWFLYLLVSSVIQYKLAPSQQTQSKIQQSSSYQQLAQSLDAFDLFRKLDCLSTLIKKQNQQINMNQTLAIEYFLMMNAETAT